MPFIKVKTSSQISDANALKSALGEAITAIPGKSESWLMVELEDNKSIYFQGSDEPAAMFEVSVFGKSTDAAYDDLTKRLCEISEKFLNVSSRRTYVKYDEIMHWGYNGGNF